jgi:predicted nucleic acid-binding protein
MIHLDTSVLIDALSGPRRSAKTLRDAIASGERVNISTLVLFEWLRGPRKAEELHAQEQLFPRGGAAAFGGEEAALAAKLYRSVRGARGREIDLAIAACAIADAASLWTLNPEDFGDIPGLFLYEPAEKNHP